MGMTFEQATLALTNYVRKAKGGYPPDRWTTGVDGDQRLVNAIEAYMAGASLIAAELSAVNAHIKEMGEASMGLGPKRTKDGT